MFKLLLKVVECRRTSLGRFYYYFYFPLQTAPKIFGGEVKSHLLCFFAGDNEEYLTALREVAKDFKGRVSLVTCTYHVFFLLV